MAHTAQQNFVKSIQEKFPDNFKKVRVLEVGSYNVNGTVRDFFDECEFIGLDIAEGDCVDVVCSGHEYKSRTKFDTIITCEMFEHNPYWAETWNNMVSLTKKNGLIVMTCASTGRPEHGTRRTTPNNSLGSNIGEYSDYYGNLTELDFKSICDFDKVFSEYSFLEENEDLYFYGRKK